LIMESARFYNMPGINVWVAPIEPEIADDGLDREQIRLEVEKRLICAGLPAIQQFDGRQAPQFPCLGVVLYVFRPQGDPPVYIFSIDMSYVQRIALAGPPATEAMHMAWCREATGEISRDPLGFNWNNLYKSLEFLVDSFIVEYFLTQASVFQLTEANPSYIMKKLSTN
jgi:hypothetical protein